MCNEKHEAASGRSLPRLVRLYRQTAKACAKSNRLLKECSDLEEEIFGTTRNDSNLDALIDTLEYSSGPSELTVNQVREIWSDHLPNVK